MHRTRHAAVGLAVIALAAALAVSPALDQPAASAATTGAGIPGLTPYGNFLGNFLAPDGTRVYCIDSALDWPAGTTEGAELVDTLQATWGEPIPAATLVKLNYVLLKYGETDDPVQAAAVAAFVYAYTSGWAHEWGPGHAAGAFYLNGNPDVTRVYDAIWADAEANSTTTATASVEIRMTDALSGVVIVSTSAPQAIGTLQLTGAVLADTGESSRGLAGSAEIPLRGLPADGALEYSIAATAAYSVATPAAANVVLYATGDQQRTIRGGTPGSFSFEASAHTDAIPVPRAPSPELPATGTAPTGVGLIAGGMLAAGSALGISARRRRCTPSE
jgi:LPXTG-motif cell wall-anchored protein